MDNATRNMNDQERPEGEILYIQIDQLVPDPDNPRRFYPPEDVQAMADSIRQAGGVDQALLVTPREENGTYSVIDGHFRLAGAQLLGDDAPALKCEVRRGLSRREKLLIMARTSALWFAKDPISEARHYRRLIEEEGVTRTKLARSLGCSAAKISGRLKLLELDPEIQELVAQGDLPKSPPIVDAFAQVSDRQARVELAREVARRRTSLKGIARACERLVERIEEDERGTRIAARREDGESPSLAIAAEDHGRELPGGDQPAEWNQARRAAREACDACQVKASSLAEVAEPA